MTFSLVLRSVNLAMSCVLSVLGRGPAELCVRYVRLQHQQNYRSVCRLVMNIEVNEIIINSDIILTSRYVM